MSDTKQKLLTLQAELSNRIAKIDKDFQNRKTSTKFSEQVTQGQNDAVLLNLKNEAQFELEQIQRALVKLQNDEYGLCEKCHSDIGEARLEAVPFASTCQKCAV